MKHFCILLLSLLSSLSFGQYSIRGYGFQGYAVDQDGKAISNEPVSVKFTISSNSAGASGPFTETKTLNTDAFGIFSHTIGEGDAVFGSLNFNRFDYKLTVAIDGMIISDKTLDAVPYARSAANGNPVGTILPFAGDATKVPSGWLICDGTSYSNTGKFSQLFDVISTTWGKGASDFMVPDLRGVFLRGVNGMGSNGNRTDVYSDEKADRQVGTFQDDIFKSHNHKVTGNTKTDGNHSHGYISGNGSNAGISSGGHNADEIGYRKVPNTTTGSGAHKHSIDFDSGNKGGLETRPVNAAVLYIIKY